MILKTAKDSDTSLTSTHLWSAPVPYFEPRITKPRTGLRMAAIVSDRLYQGLKFEGELLLLTPENWKLTLGHGKPDFLLVESCWDTATGHWYLAQSHPGEEQDILVSIIRYCRKNHIPTVYWHTQDLLYYDVFSTFATNFDFVFCADPKNRGYLQKNSIRADLLLPAIQPAIHNPFRDFEVATEFSIDILFDGWADIFRMPDRLQFLKKFKDNNLAIIESRYNFFPVKCHDTKDFLKNILGCVNMASRTMALKYAKLCVMADATLSTPTLQQWLALESAACRIPVLHRGQLDNDDIRKGVVTELHRDDDITAEGKRLLDKNVEREKKAHLGWRTVYQHHTYSHRLTTICGKIGVQHEWEEFPPVTIISPTYRQELLGRCVINYDKQKYSNKELVIVYNNNSLLPADIMAIDKTRKDVTILTVPQEKFTGACMNRGAMVATGDYFFKMDDDDYYGEHYLFDMMLHLKSVEADVFGKFPNYYYFENDRTTFVRDTPEFKYPCAIRSEDLAGGKVWMGGNTISGRREFCLSGAFPESLFGAADSCFQQEIGTQGTDAYIFDSLNCVASRREDENSHTWAFSKRLRENLTPCCSNPEDLLF